MQNRWHEGHSYFHVGIGKSIITFRFCFGNRDTLGRLRRSLVLQSPYDHLCLNPYAWISASSRKKKYGKTGETEGTEKGKGKRVLPLQSQT